MILNTCFWEYFAVEKHVTGSGMTTKRPPLPMLAYYIKNIGLVNNLLKTKRSEKQIPYFESSNHVYYHKNMTIKYSIALQSNA
ncbi:hypothetical protein Hanom_Chr12g01114641 [Helianthus anomalus]